MGDFYSFVKVFTVSILVCMVCVGQTGGTLSTRNKHRTMSVDRLSQPRLDNQGGSQACIAFDCILSRPTSPGIIFLQAQQAQCGRETM